uniref:Uncharacterized protein n=1 Tax=Romanomermis culicivorax TaxID=13658 RepID=A0A915HQE3_ROMCU
MIDYRRSKSILRRTLPGKKFGASPCYCKDLGDYPRIPRNRTSNAFFLIQISKFLNERIRI